ncbi:MAG: type transport system ATP-binding protein [Actinomycetota bacterium]|nr:type transport system ATP-binding protein [Actinomycetota bacterium]
MAGPAVEVVDLVKRYPKRDTNAVDGISFQVGSGECFGLLGPNGAGKTTTIGVLTTRVKPTGGAAFVGGVDVVASPVRARTRLGVVPQRANLDRSLDVRQNLLFHASYHGVPAKVREARATELLEQLGLADRAKEKVDRLSGGQSQRVMIARALMHFPPVLFLDEPATGLDPAARIYVWDRIRELKDSGVTVLLTTHDMDEAATLADRVGIVDHGRLLALDTPLALTKSLIGSGTLEIVVESADDTVLLLAELEQLPGVERVEPVGNGAVGGGVGGGGGGGVALRTRLYVSVEPARFVAPVAEIVTRRQGRLTEVRLGEPSLEDVFIHLTGRALR